MSTLCPKYSTKSGDLICTRNSSPSSISVEDGKGAGSNRGKYRKQGTVLGERLGPDI